MKLKLLFLSIFFFCFAQSQISISSPVDATICVDNNSEFVSVNLMNYNSQFSDNVNFSFKYFSNLSDAQTNINSIPSLQNISGSTTFYVRVESPQDGFAIGSLNIILNDNCEMSVSEIVSGKIQIYPNPVVDFIMIKSEEKFIKADVFSLLGTKLSSSKDANVNLSKVKSGVYILKVFTDKSEKSFKIIKK
ncbi:T9SS type A sorting domain-containing protein [Chryseobacterium sp. KACC 21268]|nr:T9SS type A sorting domain-containing protein [Chryseobacterium sp. KACC 21268]